jgi:hypothetical protein
MNRKEIIRRLESNETFNEVLNIIKHECHTHGTQFDVVSLNDFIAGGAVANTLHYMFNKDRFDKPIINDVDVFSFEFAGVSEWYDVRYERNLIDSFITSNLERCIGEDYGQHFLAHFGDEICMTDTSRDGIINEVKLKVLRRDLSITMPLENYYLEVIKNFDLNCCMAGLDRINNKIIYTDEFVDFILFNRIEVTELKFPLQTAYRMKRKAEELDTIKSNLKSELLLLKHSSRFRGVNQIGPIWIERVENNISLFSENFNFVSVPKSEEGDFEKKYYTTKELPKLDIELLWGVSLQSLLRYDKSQLLVFWDLFFRGKHSDEVTKAVLDFIEPDTDEQIIEVHRSPIESSIYFKFFILKSISYSKDYLNCGLISKSDLNRLYKFTKYLHKHGIDFELFSVENIEKQMELIDFFKRRFIKDNLFRNRIFRETMRTIRSKKSMENLLTSPNYSDKIKALNFGINNQWLNWSSNFKFRHYFVRNKISTLIDF